MDLKTFLIIIIIFSAILLFVNLKIKISTEVLNIITGVLNIIFVIIFGLSATYFGLQQNQFVEYQKKQQTILEKNESEIRDFILAEIVSNLEAHLRLSFPTLNSGTIPLLGEVHLGRNYTFKKIDVQTLIGFDLETKSLIFEFNRDLDKFDEDYNLLNQLIINKVHIENIKEITSNLQNDLSRIIYSGYKIYNLNLSKFPSTDPRIKKVVDSINTELEKIQKLLPQNDILNIVQYKWQN